MGKGPEKHDQFIQKDTKNDRQNTVARRSCSNSFIRSLFVNLLFQWWKQCVLLYQNGQNGDRDSNLSHFSSLCQTSAIVFTYCTKSASRKCSSNEDDTILASSSPLFVMIRQKLLRILDINIELSCYFFNLPFLFVLTVKFQFNFDERKHRQLNSVYCCNNIISLITFGIGNKQLRTIVFVYVERITWFLPIYHLKAKRI